MRAECIPSPTLLALLLWQQLARDALEIHAPLAHRLGVHHLSAGLEDLAFKALYPTEYEDIRCATEARMGVYQEVMITAKGAVGAALRKDKWFMSQVSQRPFGSWPAVGTRWCKL